MADGTRVHKAPSELQNFWMTDQPGMQAFSQWCYQSSPEATAAGLETKKLEIKDE